MNYRLCAYSLQDIGQRPNQEDCFYPTFIEPCQFSEIDRDMVYYDGVAHIDDRLFILCDGMGGHDYGEVASQTVTYEMSRALLRTSSIEGEFDDSLIQKATDEAHKILTKKSVDSLNMGTTMAVLKFHANGVTIGHIGDSRVYQFRPNTGTEPAKTLFCTKDHAQGHMLTRAIMANEASAPECEIDHITDIRPGDIFLLCSDGITGCMSDEALCSLLTNPNYGDVERVQRLLRECKDAMDNHSAIIIRVVEIINEKDGINCQLPLSPGTVLKSQNYSYNIEKTLGKGSFGITYLANVPIAMKGQFNSLQSGIPVTIKEFAVEGKMQRIGSDLHITSDEEFVKNFADNFRQEATSLALLSHPNIVQILEVFEANNTIYYSMEYLPDGNLNDYACMSSGLPEKEAISFIRQIGSALSFIHANHMLHLDVKPDNVMRKGADYVKLIDFGLVKNISTELAATDSFGVGTTGFAPLEQIDSKSNVPLSPATDVYALGATYYKLLAAFTPNDAVDVSKNGLNLQPLKAKGISKKSIDAIVAAMQPDKDKRLQSAEEFLAMLPSISNDADFIQEKGKSEFPWKIIIILAIIILGFLLLQIILR